MKIEDLSGNYLILSSDIEDFEVEILDVIEYENVTYICALPVDEPECNEIYIMQEKEDGENAEYLSVDDDDLLDGLFSEFKRRNQDVFDFSE